MKYRVVALDIPGKSEACPQIIFEVPIHGNKKTRIFGGCLRSYLEGGGSFHGEFAYVINSQTQGIFFCIRQNFRIWKITGQFKFETGGFYWSRESWSTGYCESLYEWWTQFTVHLQWCWHLDTQSSRVHTTGTSRNQQVSSGCVQKVSSKLKKIFKKFSVKMPVGYKELKC